MSDDDLVRRINERLGGISTPEVFDGDNLSIVLCTAFEDDGEQNENGWTDAAIEGCEQTLQAIRDHYAPLADRIKELEAKLAKAVQALETIAGPHNWTSPHAGLGGSMDDDLRIVARTTLAELKGETDE